MKFIHKTLGYSLLALGIAGSSMLFAKTQTMEYCFLESDPEDAVCKAYISGFLDGSVITDAAIVDRLIEYGNQNAVSGPDQNLINNPPTFYADFCLPIHISVEQAVEQVFFKLAVENDADQDMSAAVYDIIKSEFPCG